MNYEEVKNYSYDQMISYLKEKYGLVKGNYFNKDFTYNTAIRRNDEGLFIHHIQEIDIPGLSKKEIAEKHDFALQQAENLVYCDFLEHLFLHILIAKAGHYNQYIALTGTSKIDENIEQFFENDVYNPSYNPICYDLISEDYDIYLELKGLINEVANNTSLLFEHNDNAYKQLEYFLDKGNKAYLCIDTGGGKTTTALEYIKNHMGNVLVLGGRTNNIASDWQNSSFNSYHHCITAITQQAFLTQYKNLDFNYYSIIIIDEAQHAVSTTQCGQALKEVMQQYPHLKYIGLSADLKRNDEIKNVADDMYDGNLCRGITLSEGLEQDIFNPFSYITACYDLNADEIREHYKPLIADELYHRLDVALNNTPELKSILTKYMPHDKRKIIVFCSDIKSIDEAENILVSIFPQYTYKRMHSHLLEAENKKTKEWFEHTDEGVLLTVDMANEGVHFSGINTLIMFRKTASPLIVHQELGRIITLKQRVPDFNGIVFDLVNNINILANTTDEGYNKLLKTLKEIERRRKNNPQEKQLIIACTFSNIVALLKLIHENIGFHYASWEIDIIKKYYPYESTRKTVNRLNKQGQSVNTQYYRTISAITSYANDYLHLCKIPQPYIYQLDLVDYHIINTFTSLQEAADAVGAFKSNIAAACSGKHSSSAGFYWCLVSEYTPAWKPTKVSLQHHIYQLDLIDYHIIQKFNSYAEATKVTGVKGDTIADCCQGKRACAGDFYWCDEADYTPNWKPIKTANRKAIYCYETQETFKSVSLGAQTHGITLKNLSQAIDKPNRTAGNLHWCSLDNKDNFHPISRYYKLAKPIICIDLKTFYLGGGPEAAKILNVNKQSINNCCNKKQNTAGKMHWRFATEEEIQQQKYIEQPGDSN